MGSKVGNIPIYQKQKTNNIFTGFPCLTPHPESWDAKWDNGGTRGILSLTFDTLNLAFDVP